MAETGGDNEDPGYDTSKYVSRDEYLRDVAALKNKWVKIILYFAIAVVIGTSNVLLINYTAALPVQLHWIVDGFAMDEILSYMVVIAALLVVGIWVGVAKHKFYSLAYFAGFATAGFVFMVIPGDLIVGIYVFTVSACLFAVVYLVFFRIWNSVKRAVVVEK
jgi:hypothetical protein